MINVVIHCVCTVCKVSLCSPLARGESKVFYGIPHIVRLF